MTREELAKIIRKDYEEKGVWALKTSKITMQLDFEMFFIILEALEQEPKTGHWIAEENEEMKTIGYFCSECDLPMETEDQTRFCPNCGAKMVDPQETETWNGYHRQITAPKGTFEKIYEDAESEK